MEASDLTLVLLLKMIASTLQLFSRHLLWQRKKSSSQCSMGCHPAPELQKRPAGDEDSVDIGDGLHLLKGRVEGGTAEELGAEDSDLVPGQYEGGFKLWECAVDLCRCLCQEWDIASTLLTHKTDPCPALVGKRVLELGCGHGLPGIIPLLAGAQVHFQDYNRQVLVELTGPNVAANRQKLPPSRRAASARYFAGDWQALGRLLSREGLGGSYDIILASECIYNESTQRQLLECIKQSIKPPSGCAYIAAKTYYFGVGGGTSSFKQLLKQEGVLEAKVVAMLDDGKGNKREILKLTFPELLTPYFL